VYHGNDTIATHLQQVSRALGQEQIQQSSQNGWHSGHGNEDPPAVDVEAPERDADAAVGDDDPGKPSTEERPHHPENGLDTEVGPSVFVANELRTIGEDDGEGAANSVCHVHVTRRKEQH